MVGDSVRALQQPYRPILLVDYVVPPGGTSIAPRLRRRLAGFQQFVAIVAAAR
jgi:hypothetical protein